MTPIARQAIHTYFVPATNARASRIKAQCDRGSITISWDDSKGIEGNHCAACSALVRRFLAEDTDRYAQDPKRNPWRGPWQMGSGYKRGYCFVSSNQDCRLTIKV